MSTEHSNGRWPFDIHGPSVMGRRTDPDTDDPAIALLTAASSASDTDPLSLPTLNDRIDPDCLEPLLAEFPAGTPDGVRMAVEVTMGEVSVLLRDDGRIGVYPEGREPNELEPSTILEHDWSDGARLHQSIGRAVAASSDVDRIDVTRRLLDRIDVEATDRLLRPRSTGARRCDSRLLLSVDGVEVEIVPGGTIAVEPSLAVLKRAGAALLVVGSVPEQGFDRTTASLLGDPDQPRSPVIVLHGRDHETARRRLSMAGVSPGDGMVLDHRATARGTATARDRPTDVQEPDVVPVEGGLDGLPAAVDGAVGDAAPGELRICVDSLRSMIDSNGVEPTREGIEPLCRTVRERHGVGTFVLPVDAGSETVERFAPLFDGIVELRTGDAGVEQRWRLTGPGHETALFPAG